jgi:tRNA(Ile)-lysidine synthase
MNWTQTGLEFSAIVAPSQHTFWEAAWAAWGFFSAPDRAGHMMSRMQGHSLASVVSAVPPGRWAVGVSGGADSVALLNLLGTRPDLSLHVVHLDHQTRGDASHQDAEFVRRLAATRGLCSTIANRAEIESSMNELVSNPSARYRVARMDLFRRAIIENNLTGVILAHHADDQAETILHRLLRGSCFAGLVGMSPQTRIGGMLVLRPLLDLRSARLREYLIEIGQDWREDASNASDKYLRNRLRQWLRKEPELHENLLAMSKACRAMRDWARDKAPELPNSFAAESLNGLPVIVALEAAKHWLISHGAPANELSQAALQRLIDMANDAGSPPRAHFPGSLLVRRKGGLIFVQNQSA